MFLLNRNLSKILVSVKNENNEAYNTIVNALNDLPSAINSYGSENSSLTISSYGVYNNEFGEWDVCLGLNETGKVNKIVAKFVGEKGSRKPVSTNVSLSINDIDQTKLSLKSQNLINFLETKMPNYRFCVANKINLTTKDIAKLSKGQVSKNYSINLERVDNKLEIVGSYVNNSDTKLAETTVEAM